MTIPTGHSTDGRATFLTGFGLPLEEALLTPLQGRAAGRPGVGISIASGLNPLIKAPLEGLTNTDLFSGRKLSDLKPSAAASAIGRFVGDENPQFLSRVVANTPATRFVTSIDRLMDERKSAVAKLANLATGLKVADVDLVKARIAEAAQARNEIMSGMPHLRATTSYHARPGEVANLTPDEVEMLRLQATRHREHAREKKTSLRIGFQAQRQGG